VEDDVVIRKAIEYRCDASLTLGTPVEVVCFSFELSRPFASALRFLRRLLSCAHRSSPVHSELPCRGVIAVYRG